ncbi:MAG: bifunctional folylpolyglutamate synthase/dihydrofolate synthase [Alphaproteobacteria bacterium]
MYQADITHQNKALQTKLESLYSLNRGKHIDLSFRPPYLDLLNKLGNPQEHLPPVIHVAGTNGKGSTIAMLRSILCAAGYKVHVYTSPHLRQFNERIVLAGEMISDDYLEALIDEALALNKDAPITFFEITTAIAFTAFMRVPADIVLLEVGMGGRLDCTNILSKPYVSLINRISKDHMEYLGNSLPEIAREKAGIIKYETPCIIGYQACENSPITAKSIVDVFVDEARDKNAPLYCAGQDWSVENRQDGFYFTTQDKKDFYPHPNLIGPHQIENAGLTLATLDLLQDEFPLTKDAIQSGLQNIHWPGRLERIYKSPLNDLLGENDELWYDGGHNDSAGMALAKQLQIWQRGNLLKTHLVLGMKADKNPQDFLTPLLPYIETLSLTRVNDIGPCITKEHIEPFLKSHDIPFLGENDNVKIAIKDLTRHASNTDEPKRILICGSLYLAGQI